MCGDKEMVRFLKNLCAERNYRGSGMGLAQEGIPEGKTSPVFPPWLATDEFDGYTRSMHTTCGGADDCQKPIRV